MPEKIIIGISVENKIASVADKNAVIVCGNSNYKAVFAFDSEWENYKVKTALFATENGDNGTIAVVFEGNECDIPPLTNTTIVGVGVASGDLTQGEEVELATTTPAYIGCLLSIKDLGGITNPPAPDVYDQIIALLNKYIQQGGGGSGETGGGLTEAEVKEIVQAETQGLQPKVDDGLETESKSVVGAINETNSKALATIESSIADGTYSVKLVFQNAKGEAIAETTFDLPLSEFVKFTDYATANKAGIVKTNASLGIAVGDHGDIRIQPASRADILAKKSAYNPICADNNDYAVKVGITSNTETLTDEEKQAVASWIGTQAQNKPNTLVQRYGSGNIAVPLVPTAEVHATSKKYVDTISVQYNHMLTGVLDGETFAGYTYGVSFVAKTAIEFTTVQQIVEYYGAGVDILAEGDLYDGNGVWLFKVERIRTDYTDGVYSLFLVTNNATRFCTVTTISTSAVQLIK